MRTQIITASAACLLLLAGCSGESESRSREPGTVGNETGDVPYITLQVGDCLNSEDIIGAIDNVTLIDCTQPHDAEVISSHEIGDTYPGFEDLLAQIEQECTAYGQEWAQEAPGRGNLALAYVMPTEADFGQGITNFLCLAVAPEPISAPM